jgi:hypothetical protein
MTKVIKNYDCVGEVRKIRARLGARWANDPEGHFKYLEKATEKYFKSIGVNIDFFR